MIVIFIKFYQGGNYKLHEGTLVYIENSAWTSFTKEGSKNCKNVIVKLLFFEQGSILRRANFWEKHFLKYCEMSLERGNSDI